MEISSKQQLIERAQQTFDELLTCIERVPAKRRKVTVKTNERDQNFRDVLMHLYEWHAMLEPLVSRRNGRRYANYASSRL